MFRKDNRQPQGNHTLRMPEARWRIYIYIYIIIIYVFREHSIKTMLQERCFGKRQFFSSGSIDAETCLHSLRIQQYIYDISSFTLYFIYLSMCSTVFAYCLHVSIPHSQRLRPGLLLHISESRAPGLFRDAPDRKCSVRGVRGDQRSSVLVWADVREKCTAASASVAASAPSTAAPPFSRSACEPLIPARLALMVERR